jgi:hypothetical protein
MSKSGRWPVVAWAAGLGVCLAGCTGEVAVWLVDTSEPVDGEPDVAELVFPLAGVDVRGAQGWVALPRGPNPYNLLDFTGDESPIDLAGLRAAEARIGYDELPAGAFSAVRVRLEDDEPLEVEDSDGVDHAVTLADAAALTVAVNAEVQPDAPLSLLVSLDVRAALRPAAGGGYTFAPVLSVETHPSR